jgi:hypothetical protein
MNPAVKWCQFITESAGKCGLVATIGERCHRHAEKEQKPKRVTQTPFSGPSTYNLKL